VQNLMFVTLPVPEIIRGIQKNLGSWMDPVNVPAKFEVRSFTRSKKFGQSMDTNTVPFLPC